MKIKHRQNGSIIVEVLVAASIFAVGLLALAEFQSNLLRDRTLINQEEIALSLANNKMQQFRHYTLLTSDDPDFASAPAYSNITTDLTGVTYTDGATTYTTTWTVTDSADTPTRKNVLIQVTWQDPTASSHTVNAESIIARIDPLGTGKVSKNLP